ncbi:MAG: P-II family nitrogen regulator [Candidatus Weimeria sp.]
MAGSEISKIVIMCPPERFSMLKDALRGVGIAGMTVIHADGCGLQGGRVEYYRGTQIEVDLLPKTKVEIIVPSSKAQQVVDIAKRELYTGTIGDGKIFIYDVKEVIRISTGDTGLKALETK